jgi:hypothetical protein
MNEINLLLTSAITLVNFARQSKLVDGKTKAQLDRAYVALLDANRELEDKAIALSDNIINS